MLQALKDSLFLCIPIAVSIALSFILAFLYFKDRNPRKLVFAIGVFLSAFAFYSPAAESFGVTPIFPSGEWLFIPIALAVLVAALSGLLQVSNFKVPFMTFMIGTMASLAAYFTQLPSTALRFSLTIASMTVAVPILMYLFLKSRGTSDLNFLLATLCFLFQGLVGDLGSSIDIPVLLEIFGVVFLALMFNGPNAASPSSIASFVVLEQKLSEANQNLKSMKEKLANAERLAAIGELAGIIGHDLRNPLQGIVGATYYLKMHSGIAKQDAVCRDMFNEIDDCIERSDKIINDLIEYSQVINLQPTVTDPKSLTMRSLGQVEIPANVEVINLTASNPTVRIDNNHIERAFVGIIKNAFDAMPEGGKLAITSKATDDSVVFSFQDTGVGMSEETLSRLWTPLFTTKAKGMGFGLAISKRFVEAHRGRIAARSAVGAGTTITVTLPRGRADS